MQVQELEQRLRECVAPVAESPSQLEAECQVVMAVCLGLSPEEVKAAAGRAVEPHVVERVEGLMRERVARRTPMQYLLSEARFHGLRLRVGPAVLIPRPETEALVDAVLGLCRERRPARPGFRIMDMGTGSGAIALAVAWFLQRMPEAAPVRVIATDSSARALEVARDNAASLGVADIVELLQGDTFSVVQGQRFDIIASNPPYLEPSEVSLLPIEVRDNEPWEAVFSDRGKYGFYELLAQQGPRFLVPGGHVAVEVGDTMAPSIADIFRRAGFAEVRILKDRFGMERVVVARHGG